MKNFKHILALLSPWKWQFLGSSLLLILGIFIRMLEPFIFQVAIDYVAPMFNPDVLAPKVDDNIVVESIVGIIRRLDTDSMLHVFLVLGGIYLIVSILRATFVFIAKTINAHATEKSVASLRNTFFSHVQRLPMEYYPSISTGELIQRSTGDIETIRRFVGNQTVEVLRLSAIFIFSAYWLFSTNFWFGLVAIAAVPFIAISSYVFFKKEQKVWQRHEDEADKLNAIVQENLAGIRVVKAFAQEEEEIEQFEHQNKRKLNVALEHAKLHTMFWPFSDFLVHTQIIISIFVGGYMTFQQLITPGQLVVFYTFIIMVAWPLRQVGRLLSEMGMAFVAMSRIQSILKVREEQDLNSGLNEFEAINKIEFKDVWFKYEDDKEYILKGINLVIEPGSTVAILGPTGSGKSTLSKLLLRFYEPDKGVIYINDIPIKDFSKMLLRKRIGLMLQQAFLFTDSVRGNMNYASVEKSDERIKSIAALSGLDEIESIFNDGFDTLVGEKGVTLSGGQKQRVAIARTLLQEPDLLILDDVTSAVDSVTEAAILSRLGASLKEKTTLIITHRLTAIPYVDSIIVLKDGAIDAQGSHQELLKTNAFYQGVNDIQNIVELEIDSLKK